MKRRWCSILAVLALVLCLLPITAAAELLPDVAAGDTLDTVSAGNQVSKNAGTIKMNNGWISNNLATGIVQNNSNMVDSHSKDGSISQNSGTVVSNSGFVDLNYGEVTQNKGTSFNGVTNGVGQNFGTVDTNQGQVKNNHPEGIVKYNEANCRVDLNEGTVKYNSGDIYSNSGTVENMQGGTIQSNSGTVENMQGGTIKFNSGTVENMTGGKVYNSEDGSVTNSTGGELWWAAEISGGENVTFTNTETVDGRTFLKPGSTLAPAGERDILKVTAENADLAPEGRGFKVTAITAAPVTLTVETLPAVALVRVNGEETYYADIQEAFTAAKGAGDATVELLADAVLPDGKALTVGAGQMINLNCNEFTLSGNSGWVIGVEKGGTLEFSGGTLKNTASRFGSAVSVDGGSFIMSGGTLEASDADMQAVAAVGFTDSEATVTIRRGSVGAGGCGLDIGAHTTVRLSGGTYGSIGAGSSFAPDTTVPGLLETGYSALYHPANPKRSRPLQPATASTTGGNSRANACPQEAGGQRGTPCVSACEPPCAILPSRAWENPWKKSCAKVRWFTRDEEKQEKALALSVRQGGYFCPQCGQLRGRKLTLF